MTQPPLHVVNINGLALRFFPAAPNHATLLAVMCGDKARHLPWCSIADLAAIAGVGLGSKRLAMIRRTIAPVHSIASEGGLVALIPPNFVAPVLDALGLIPGTPAWLAVARAVGTVSEEYLPEIGNFLRWTIENYGSDASLGGG